MEEALVSIVIPVYNVEKYVEKCVNSVLAQSYRNTEIILVDDGATDGSPTLCDQYAEKDDRVKVIHKKNGGLSDARNAGIEFATGEYLMFVDGDDYISPDMVEILYNAITREKAELSICNFLYVTGDAALMDDNNTNLPIQDEVISGEIVLKEKLFEPKSWYWVTAINKLYDKRLFNEIRFEKGKIHEDEFILHKIMLQCKRIACVSDGLYFYVQRTQSIMHSKLSIKALDKTEAFFLRAQDLSSMPGFEKASSAFLRRGVGFFCWYYKTRGMKLDKEHREKNKKLQIIYRATYKTLSYKRISLQFYKKVFMILNFFDMMFTTRIYSCVSNYKQSKG